MIGESNYRFSEDGRHFTYVGNRRTGAFAAIDGVQSREYEAISGDAYFDPTGSTSFYIARVDGVNRLVLNGELQLEYEARGRPVFSSDGSHFAFVARVPGGDAVVIDGKAGPPFEWIPNLLVAPNGRVSYDGALKRKRSERQRFAFVVDENVVAESSSLFWRLSPDGRHIYYLDHDLDRWFADGEPLPERTKYAEFAPDGRLYTVVDDQAFVDGVPLAFQGRTAPNSPRTADIPRGRRRWAKDRSWCGTARSPAQRWTPWGRPCSARTERASPSGPGRASTRSSGSS